MAIHGKKLRQSARDEVIAKMENSPIEFYLHGSQYSGHNREESDWDFFCEDGEEAMNFLLANGFKIIRDTTNKYTDCLTKSVMRHEAGVDVSLVEAENLDTKKLMRTIDCALRRSEGFSRSRRLELYRLIAEELQKSW